MSESEEAGVKRGFFGPMKGLDSAETGLEELPGGRLRASIVHQPMRGVTAEHLRWWFENIDMWTTFNGVDFTGPPVRAYRFWHPWDHVAVRWERKVTGPDRRVGPGSIIAIREDIGGKYKVDARARVYRFDDEAFDFALLAPGKAPIEVGTLTHHWSETSDGLAFETVATIGPEWSVLGPAASRLVRKVGFPDKLMEAWLLHNIEESGETEQFVPMLFEHAHR